MRMMFEGATKESLKSLVAAGQNADPMLDLCAFDKIRMGQLAAEELTRRSRAGRVSCSECIHWRHVAENVGQCRVRPPTKHGSSIQVWPMTNRARGCGEGVRKA